MPTYEYECRACSHRFERKQSFSDEPVKVCPTCGGETRRLISPPGIVFKGSGWYITDSRKSGDSEGGSSAPSTSGASTPSAPASPSSDSSSSTPSPSSSSPGTGAAKAD